MSYLSLDSSLWHGWKDFFVTALLLEYVHTFKVIE